MTWLFLQVFLYCLVSFLLGGVVTWFFLVRPRDRRDAARAEPTATTRTAAAAEADPGGTPVAEPDAVADPVPAESISTAEVIAVPDTAPPSDGEMPADVAESTPPSGEQPGAATPVTKTDPAPETPPAVDADAVPHADTAPHADAVPHGDTAPRADTAPHADAVPHGDTAPRADTVPHGDAVPHGDTVPHGEPAAKTAVADGPAAAEVVAEPSPTDHRADDVLAAPVADSPDDPVLAAAPVSRVAAAGTPSEAAGAATATAFAELGPYGEGSVNALPDGSAPSDHYTVKGNAHSMLYHTRRSPYFGRTRADVWFRTEEDAERGGFTAWNRRRTR